VSEFFQDAPCVRTDEGRHEIPRIVLYDEEAARFFDGLDTGRFEQGLAWLAERPSSLPS